LPALTRSITPLHATALVVGIIIGASIFVQPSVITGAVPTLRAVYAVWIVSGILTLFGALIAAELASAFPAAGGVYVFLRESWTPGIAFLWGWAMFWTMHTGIIAAIATVFARYAAYFVDVGPTGSKVLAVGAVLLLSGINYVGVRQGSLVQTTITIAKVVAIVAIILVAFAIGPRTGISTLDVPAPAQTAAVPGALTARTFALALVAGLFAFGGWHMVTYAAEETREPERTIPRALAIGVVLVTACYVALNAAYFHVLPAAVIARSTRVAADAANAVIGPGGAAVTSAIVAVSTFGALNGVILAGPRVYLSMARDGLLFRWIAGVHERFHTPHRAIALQAVWASILVATGSYRVLFTRVVYTEWIFFALMAVGLMRLRRRQNYSPAYRVWGCPLVPIIFTLSSLYIVANQLLSEPKESAVGLVLVAVGLPVYWISRSSKRNDATAAPPFKPIANSQ
jgi:APA family basic amino acid/polyamine antiporter